VLERWHCGISITQHAFLPMDAVGLLSGTQALPHACPLPCLQGENPVYVWVPLTKPKRRREKGMVEEEVSDLQVGGCMDGCLDGCLHNALCAI
jgi:hypothetical protein